MRVTRRSAAKTATVLAASSLPLASAQTSTSCNPTNTTCPSDTGLATWSFSSDFTQGSSANTSWTAAEGTTITYGSDGAEFTISENGQAPTMASDFYVFFGRIEVVMKAANGTGIVSSVVLESDDLDEVDWEFLGSIDYSVQTDFFGKGNSTLGDREANATVSDPQDGFHTYTVDWTSERIEWLVDGTVERTLEYDDPTTVGGTNYPQTPMRVKLGNWAGGGPDEPAGTVAWAGGSTDFTQGPFVMYVKSVSITNYNPAETYTYGDKTGDYESIEMSNSTSSASGGATLSSGAATVASVSSASETAAPTSMVAVSGTAGNTAADVSTASGSAAATGTSVASATTQVPGVSASGSATGSASTSSSTSTFSGAGAKGVVLGQGQVWAAAGLPVVGVVMGALLL